MLENFLYVKQKDLFIDALEAGEVLNEAVVFIEDTKEIWNHGTYFDGSAVDLSDVEKSIQNILDNIPTKTSDLENDSGFITGETLTQFQNTLMSGPIQSINNKTTELENNKADKTELPTKVSDLENDSKYLNWQTVEQEIETARSIIGNCSLIEVDSQPLDLPINNEILLDTNNNILYIGIKNKIWWVIDNLKLFNPLIPDAKVIGTTLDVQGKVIDNILYTDSF